MTNSTAHKATALSGERLWLGMHLMVGACRRGRLVGLGWPALAYVATSEHDAAAYSLDAPGRMPAGACRSFQFDDDDLPAFVEQVVCEREGA